MTKRVGNPLPFFTDKRGLPMDGGRLYIGETGEDPQISPLIIYLDEDCTVTAPQPLLIVGGFATHDGNPAFFYVSQDAYSLRVRDRDGGEVYYFSDVVVDDTRWQPADSDLTAIAALTTTAYGRGLLTQANSSALRGYLGIVPTLPLSGGSVSGDILRQGNGSYVYIVGTDYTTGRIFVTPSGAADPTTLAGEIVFELEP